MLAGAEEELQARFEVRQQMSAIQTLLAGLFDYAGLYPPASLSLRSATSNYLGYAGGEHSAALGRFVANADRLEEMRSVAGDSLKKFKLSVIASAITDCDVIAENIRLGMRIEAIEWKGVRPEELERVRSQFSESMIHYVEAPIATEEGATLDIFSRTGMRAKIRTGGITPEAFPSTSDLVQRIAAFAQFRISFKATAGLHHPVRSYRPLTYKADSPKGTMHGFLNVCCAAAILYFGGERSDANRVMEEDDAAAWKFGSDRLAWRNRSWTEEQLRILRRDFFTGIGTCSFEEPVQDLFSLGWL